MRTWFKKVRDNLNLTQSEIAKKVGVTRQFIGMIESGVATPHPETAKNIANALNFKNYGYDWTKFYSNNEQIKEKMILTESSTK